MIFNNLFYTFFMFKILKFFCKSIFLWRREGNELAGHLVESYHRRPWTPTTLEALLAFVLRIKITEEDKSRGIFLDSGLSLTVQKTSISHRYYTPLFCESLVLTQFEPALIKLLSKQ